MSQNPHGIPTPMLMAQLMRHEGFYATPYLCTAGACTIGYGTNLDAHPRYIPFADIRTQAQSGRLRGAALRNALAARGMTWTKAQASAALEDEVVAMREALYQRCPQFRDLAEDGDIVRAEALVNMAFNMGVAGLLKFRNTLALIDAAHAGRTGWSAVKNALKQSLWWGQVGRRSRELGEQFRTGQYVGVH